MADSKSVPNSVFPTLVAEDRAWLKQSVAFQRSALIRARNKEITGGEVWSLRGREIDALNNLLVRLDNQ